MDLHLHENKQARPGHEIILVMRLKTIASKAYNWGLFGGQARKITEVLTRKVDIRLSGKWECKLPWRKAGLSR